MLSKSEIYAELRYLDTATWEELLARKKEIQKILDLISEGETKRDYRFKKNLLEQEIAARIELNRIELLRKRG